VTNARIVFVLVAAAIFVVDRVTKNLVASQVEYGTEVPVIDQLVGITNVRNSGAAFGFAPAGAGLFLIASVVVSIGLAVYVLRNSGDQWSFGALGLIMGGSVGNGFDRIVHGTVTDFINVHFWPVFNVADSAISIGVVLLIASYLIRRNPHEL
jgi:signal peptidase II